MTRLTWLAVGFVAILAAAAGLVAFRLWREVATARFDPVGLVSPSPGFDPAWSHDGSQIVYCRSRGTPPKLSRVPGDNHLMVWDVAKGQYRELVVDRPPEWDIFWPFWRTDGDLHVIAANQEEGGREIAELAVPNRQILGTKELWFVRLEDGSGNRVLGFGTAPTVRWVPRLGKFVANVWPKGGLFRVRFFVLSAEGEVEQETDVVDAALPICPSDMVDRETVVFCAAGPDEDPDPRTSPSMSLATYDLSTGHVTRLFSPTTGLIYTLAVSNRGDRIAYIREASPGAGSVLCDLLVWDAEQGSPRELASDACGHVCVSWSPDDKYIAYTSGEDGKIHIVSSRSKKQ